MEIHHLKQEVFDNQSKKEHYKEEYEKADRERINMKQTIAEKNEIIENQESTVRSKIQNINELHQEIKE